jgi:hypothetical protein
MIIVAPVVASFLQLCGDARPTGYPHGRWRFFSQSFAREEPRTVAIIWRSRGTVGPGSLGAGKSMPLNVIDKRLKDFRIFCHGERPKTMLPQSREYYTHIMIEVIDDDRQPRPERFPRPGFYQVVGLRVNDASFLFAGL